MPLISLEQGSSAWLEYRMGKIMATDASILMETNHWKTPLELWEEKLGLRPPTQMNDAMLRGNMLEPLARVLANEEVGMEFMPVVFESNSHNFIAASLDGISQYGDHILEIKCPKEETHKDAIEGLVPLYYMDQIQHQLLVTGAQCCFYFSYRPEFKEKTFAIVPIEPNKNRQEMILIKAQEFYIKLCTMQPPTPWIFKERK